MRVARAHSQRRASHHPNSNFQIFEQIGLPPSSWCTSRGMRDADRAAPPCPCLQVPLVLDFLLHFPATQRGRDEREIRHLHGQRLFVLLQVGHCLFNIEGNRYAFRTRPLNAARRRRRHTRCCCFPAADRVARVPRLRHPRRRCQRACIPDVSRHAPLRR